MASVTQPVAEFYHGKSVFITGATGFLGKVLLEKLLYSCPGLNNVYVLVREKKEVKGTERIRKILEFPVFQRMKAEKPEQLLKIVPITGDITKPNFGLSLSDEQKILNETSVVFHLAATIRFDETLKTTMEINVESTRTLLKLSQGMKQLEAFIYMSTAFAHTQAAVLEEILYPPSMKIHEVYKFLENHTEEEVPTILGGRPNNYSFSKALTENLVAHCDDLPIVIIRPSVVAPSFKEPMEGWIDNWFGPTPVFNCAAKGWVRVLYGEKTYNIDLIPVDYVANLTIVAATRCKSKGRLTIYNSCTSGAHPITLKQASIYYLKESSKHKFNDLPVFGFLITKKLWLIWLIEFLTLTVPAYIIDIMTILLGKPARYVKMMSQVRFVMDCIRYFSSRQWIMTSKNVQELYKTLSLEDQRRFPFDPISISWADYIPIYFRGVKKYLVKEI